VIGQNTTHVHQNVEVVSKPQPEVAATHHQLMVVKTAKAKPNKQENATNNLVQLMVDTVIGPIMINVQ